MGGTSTERTAPVHTHFPSQLSGPTQDGEAKVPQRPNALPLSRVGRQELGPAPGFLLVRSLRGILSVKQPRDQHQARKRPAACT
jgi:hypothetical protein